MISVNFASEIPLSGSDRRQAVLDLLLERDKVTVRELEERFRVSTMTVHRDLDALEDRGVLRKVRGGATLQPTGVYESSLAFRLGEHPEAKERMALVAAQWVESGSSVALDDSTSALAMLPHIARIPQVTVVTNFISVFEAVARMTDSTLSVIGIGGVYHPKYHAFGGVLAEQALHNVHADRCFLSVSAVDVERGAFHQDADQAAIKRTMIEIADDAVLLADASKFSKRTIHRVVPLDAFDAVVVDDLTEQSNIRALEAHGLEVCVAAKLQPDGASG